jgi:hypothetical protein
MVRARIAEPRVVRCDREVAHEVQHVATADRVARDHGHDGLRQATDLDLEVQDVEPPDALARDHVVAQVAVAAPHRLVAARAEGVVALTGEHDDPDGGVVSCPVERVGQLEEGLGTEGVASLGPADGDPGDALGHVVGDVGVLIAERLPLRERDGSERLDGVLRRTRDDRRRRVLHVATLSGSRRRQDFLVDG